jgi:hypothetical protein
VPNVLAVRAATILNLILSVLIATAVPVNSATQETKYLDDLWLEGTVGSALVRVFIGRAGYPKRSGLWGMYYYTNHWIPIPLDGDWVATGRVQFLEGDPSDEKSAKARFELAIPESGPVTGTWTSADRRRKLPVTLRRISKPPDYEAAGLTRRFRDPNWMITFRYPASWRLEVSGRELSLRSPDPERMLSGHADLVCERGTGLPPAPKSDEPVAFKWPFFRSRAGWVVETFPSGDCEPDGHSCQPPETRRVGRATFMRAEASSRSHGFWGYSGIGGAEAYLVVQGNQWVHCTDSVLDSDKRIEVRETSGGRR